MKFQISALAIILTAFVTSCGPSAEEIAATYVAETAAAATNTPVPTNTPEPTPTATPIPYELNVLVIDGEGMPLANSNVNLAGLDEMHTTDEEGRVTLSNLPDDSVALNASAQGYLGKEMTVTLERGGNQVDIMLERDPLALYPPDFVEEGQAILFIEDFQDGQESFLELIGGWQIVDDVDDPGNKVFEVNQHGSDDIASAYFGPEETNYENFKINYRFRYVDLVTEAPNFVALDFRDGMGLTASSYWHVYQLTDFGSNPWEFPYQMELYYQTNTWYKMGIEVEGSQATLYLNDRMEARVKGLPEYPARWSFAVGQNAKIVQFDDVVVLTLPE